MHLSILTRMSSIEKHGDPIIAYHHQPKIEDCNLPVLKWWTTIFAPTQLRGSSNACASKCWVAIKGWTRMVRGVGEVSLGTNRSIFVPWSMTFVAHGSRSSKNPICLWSPPQTHRVPGTVSRLNDLNGDGSVCNAWSWFDNKYWTVWCHLSCSEIKQVCPRMENSVCPSEIDHLWDICGWGSPWFTHFWRHGKKHRWGTRWQSTAAHTKESLWATAKMG